MAREDRTFLWGLLMGFLRGWAALGIVVHYSDCRFWS
jgi:hypothetical protein